MCRYFNAFFSMLGAVTLYIMLGKMATSQKSPPKVAKPADANSSMKALAASSQAGDNALTPVSLR